jgi:hypothetical protein
MNRTSAGLDPVFFFQPIMRLLQRAPLGLAQLLLEFSSRLFTQLARRSATRPLGQQTLDPPVAIEIKPALDRTARPAQRLRDFREFEFSFETHLYGQKPFALPAARFGFDAFEDLMALPLPI